MLSRRRALKALAVAPAAVPVVAKDAAVKMGLGDVAMSAGIPARYNAPIVATDEASHIRAQLKSLLGGEGRSRAIESARGALSRMDSDLASLRSVSPAWVLTVQAERTADRYLAAERRWLQERLSTLTGGLL
ncbi:MAG: twin-arginine translocation signal domain-containing protein [Pseudomonadota bacterium]